MLERSRHLHCGLLVLALAVMPASASAQGPFPDESSAATVSDSWFRGEVSAILRLTEPGEALPRLERLTSQPGLSDQQRLIAMSLRVNALIGSDRIADAQSLAEALVRSYPDNPHSHLTLANALFAADDYAGLADAVIKASELRADVVKEFDPYDLRLVMVQLKAARDEDRVRAFARRLLDAGWDIGSAQFQSEVAYDAIEGALANGDTASASRYVLQISSPTTLAKILTEKRFEPLRPVAEDWAGEKLEKQWPVYLERTRAAWLKEGTPESGAEYASALVWAGHDRTLVAAFLPIFEGQLDARKDYMWLFVVPTLARALARLGRWDEAFKLYDQASLLWPPGTDDNALNISANRAVLRLLHGDFDRAARMFEDVLKEAGAASNGLTPQPRVLIKSYDICARHQLGSDASHEARQLETDWAIRFPSAISRMQICLGRPDKALETWIKALGDPDSRSDVVEFAQPRIDDSPDSDFARTLARETEKIAKDGRLIHAVSEYGRRRTWAVSDAAPTEVAIPNND